MCPKHLGNGREFTNCPDLSVFTFYSLVRLILASIRPSKAGAPSGARPRSDPYGVSIVSQKARKVPETSGKWERVYQLSGFECSRILLTSWVYFSLDTTIESRSSKRCKA